VTSSALNHRPIFKESPTHTGAQNHKLLSPIPPEPCDFDYFEFAKNLASPRGSAFFTGDQVTCLVLEDTAEAAVETSLAENFHRLAMNPADEAVAFASLIEGGASIEDVARRFVSGKNPPQAG